MEFPHIGQHCLVSTCKRLDFLPMKCDACENVFCKDHILYTHHNCESSYAKDIQVPVCPLCNKPVPVKRGEMPDIRVGEHIDRDCQSDPAKEKRKIYTNSCSVRRCKQKELIKMICKACGKNYCLKHRHPQDHSCISVSTNGEPLKPTAVAAIARAKQAEESRVTFQSKVPAAAASIQGNLSEDEALARALHMSLIDSSAKPMNSNVAKSYQEEEDRKLAEALAESERQQRRNQNSSKEKCTVS